MTHTCSEANDSSHRAAIEYLLQDRLRNVLSLKMMAQHGDHVTSKMIDTADGSGVLLSLPPTVFPHDVANYPGFDRVLIPTADNKAVTESLIPEPPEGPTVFKLGTGRDYAVISSIVPLKRKQAFLEFTHPTSVAPRAPDPAVKVSEVYDEALMELFSQNGYSSSEIAGFFARGAVSFAIHDALGPASVAMAFRIFEDVWEIGGLRTQHRALRRGLSRQLTLAAVRWLSIRSLRSRYQVSETNTASIRLAETCGLEQFMCLTHFTTQ